MSTQYEIVLNPHAKRELDKVPSQIFSKIDAEIWKLRENPRPHGIKKLEDDLHRIRIGEWRVIFAIFDQEKRVVILRVVRRSERTYKEL